MTKQEKAELEKVSLKWRLKQLPDATEIAALVEQGVITKEEARQLLFSEETTNDKIKALEEQVQFLRELADKLASQPPQLVYKYIHDYTPRINWINTVTPTPYKLVGSNLMQTVSGNVGTLSMGSGTTTTYTANTGKVLDN